MKKSVLFLFLFPFMAAVAVPTMVFLHVDTYKVNTVDSRINWEAEKVTGKHNGSVALATGEITNNHGQLGGSFSFNMKSIEVIDLSGDKKSKLEGHLKSEDFFSVEKFPTCNFEITSVLPLKDVTTDGPNFNVTGKLTIKGISNEITFPAVINFDTNKMTAKADIKVDRTKYNIRYGSKTFFGDIGDKAIYDEFIIKLNIVANK